MSIRNLVPESFKRVWWYCTDAEWRTAYRSVKRRQDELQGLQAKAFRTLWMQTSGRVAAGPFKGLSYLDDREGTYPQKLLGTYERELWPVIEEIATRDYERIIDIGAAEGYYVCGLASLIPRARVIAFEANIRCHSRIQQLAKLNGLQNSVECHGLCRPEDLRRVLEKNQRTLIVCDVEGAEFELLDPDAVLMLRKVDLLVEVHDAIRPGVADELLRRFRPTHDVTVIPSMRRTIGDLPSGVNLPAELAQAAMEESRGGEMVWYWLQTR